MRSCRCGCGQSEGDPREGVERHAGDEADGRPRPHHEQQPGAGEHAGQHRRRWTTEDGAHGEPEAGGERREQQPEADHAEIGERLDVRVLDPVGTLGRREGLCGRVRELAPCVIEVVAVDLLLLARGLPAGAHDRVVEKDLPADVRQHRALDVRLDVLLRGRVVLADAEEAHELVNVAAAHDEDAERDRADDADGRERPPEGEPPEVRAGEQHSGGRRGEAEPGGRRAGHRHADRARDAGSDEQPLRQRDRRP